MIRKPCQKVGMRLVNNMSRFISEISGIKNILVALTAALFLVACTTGPRHVSSSAQLVKEPDFQRKEAIPEKYWEDLNHAANGQVISHLERRFQIGQAYTSALGHICKPFVELNGNLTSNVESSITAENISSVNKRIVCQPKGYRFWYLVPDIKNLQEPMSRL